MTNSFVIPCGAMPVRNTGYGITTDRLTDELRCPFDLPLLFGRSMACLAVFPQSLVKFQSPGVWQVEPLMRYEDPRRPDTSVKIYNIALIPSVYVTPLPFSAIMGMVEFSFEPVLRRGSKMEAQLIKSLRGSVDIDGLRGELSVTLPVVLADAFPWWQLGPLGGFTVRECLCDSTVEWAA